MASECAKTFCRREFHYSSFCLCYDDWKPFVFSPWLPERWYFQLIYIVFRWILALFFFIYIFVFGFAFGDVRFLIYLTNWGYILLTVHFMWSAGVVTYGYVKFNFTAKTRVDSPATEQASNLGCCGAGRNALTWYQMIQWLLYTISLSVAIVIVFLYWVLLVPTFASACESNVTNSSDQCVNIYTHTQIIPHLVNGVAAVADIGFCGIPIRLLHVVYPVVGFTLPYCIFSGLYHVAGGTDVVGNPYIYSVLDYGTNLGTAVGLAVISGLIVVPAVHVMNYVMYLMREVAVFLTHKYICTKREDKNSTNIDNALDSHDNL